MIQLGGMILVMVGVTVAPYVKKALIKAQATATDRNNNDAKKLTNTSDKQMLEASESHTELAVAADEERHKLRIMLTTGTMGLAIMAQTGFLWLTPVSYLLIGYFSAYIFKEAATALFKDKKIKVDILDTIVILLTLLFGQIGAAAFMVWISTLSNESSAMVVDTNSVKDRKKDNVVAKCVSCMVFSRLLSV